MYCEEFEICVTIPRYSNKFAFVTLKKGEITKDIFVKRALEALNVLNFSRELVVRLVDNRNASIPECKIAKVLTQFSKCASFFVRIDFVYEPNFDIAPHIITPEMIKTYVIKNGGESVFSYLDESENSDILPEKLRLIFVNCLADLVVKLHGLYPSERELIQISESAIALVPLLASKDTVRGVDILVNKVNGGGGYLYNRVRYLRKKEKEKSKGSVDGEQQNGQSQQVAELSQSMGDLQIENGASGNDENQMDDLLYLKTVVVNKDNMVKIEEILLKTVDRRRLLLSDDRTDLLENFPYMFVHPQLTKEGTLPDMKAPKNDCPYIIACGENHNSITHFIIAINEQPMYVPKHFSFEETLDLFFKVHTVLMRDVDPRLENVFLFLKYYIYKIMDGTKLPYTTMIALANLIMN